MALADELLSFEVQTYCAIHSRWRKLPKHIARKLGKTRELIKDSLLVGYLFVKVETQSQMAKVFAHKDVFGFVSTSAGPCFARECDIEALREIERSGVHDAKPKLRKERIAADAEATLHASKDDSKARLQAMQERLASMRMVDIVGKQVRIVAGPLAGFGGEIKQVNDRDVRIVGNNFEICASAQDVELA